VDLGYTPQTAKGVLKEVGHLGRWMVAEDVPVERLCGEVIESFVCSRRAGGAGRGPSARSFDGLLGFLRDAGVVAAADVGVVVTPVELLLADYRAWMVGDRGLAAPTVLRYENLARRFLDERAGGAGTRFVEGLTAADVTAFLLKESRRVSVGAAKGRVADCGRCCGSCT